MDAAETEHEQLWRAVAGSGARALLIGRQALVMLGAPVAAARAKDATDIAFLRALRSRGAP